jgi:hypothetical protein
MSVRKLFSFCLFFTSFTLIVFLLIALFFVQQSNRPDSIGVAREGAYIILCQRDGPLSWHPMTLGGETSKRHEVRAIVADFAWYTDGLWIGRVNIGVVGRYNQKLWTGA